MWSLRAGAVAPAFPLCSRGDLHVQGNAQLGFQVCPGSYGPHLPDLASVRIGRQQCVHRGRGIGFEAFFIVQRMELLEVTVDGQQAGL
jgi:hypothetical protein